MRAGLREEPYNEREGRRDRERGADATERTDDDETDFVFYEARAEREDAEREHADDEGRF